MGIGKWNTVTLLRNSEETKAAGGAVSFDMFVRVLWEWWAGEKEKRARIAAGRFDGHVLCAPLTPLIPLYHKPNHLKRRGPCPLLQGLISKIYRSF